MLNFLFRNLRAILRRYPALYRRFAELRGLNVDFPGPNTSLHITGYPRCATTSTLYILKQFFPPEKLTSHIHTIADLKIAKSRRIPTLVLFRKPKEVVSSAVLKKRNQPENQNSIFRFVEEAYRTAYVDTYIDYYIRYYRFVLDNSDHFVLAGFETVIASPIDILRRLETSTGFDLNKKEARIEKGRQEYKNWKQRESAKPEIAGLPNEKKEKKKRKIKRAVVNHPHFHEAEQTYEALKSIAEKRS